VFIEHRILGDLGVKEGERRSRNGFSTTKVENKFQEFFKPTHTVEKERTITPGAINSKKQCARRNYGGGRDLKTTDRYSALEKKKQIKGEKSSKRL